MSRIVMPPRTLTPIAVERNTDWWLAYRGSAADTACAVCQEPAAHIHHIVGGAQGRHDAPWNLVLLCPRCHAQYHDSGAVAKPAVVAAKHAQERHWLSRLAGRIICEGPHHDDRRT